MASTAQAATSPSRFAAPDIVMDRRGDGTIVLSSRQPPRPASGKVGEWLVKWAKATPDAVFVAQRQAVTDPWRTVTYREALDTVTRLATSLLGRDLSPERPLAVLSDNSIEVLMLSLAAMHVGVPVASITSAYSLIATDFTKLRAMIELVTPGLIYAEDGTRFAKALAAIADLGTAETVALHNLQAGQSPYRDLLAEPDVRIVHAAFDRVGPDTVTRILFTSGSTGVPKGVINTQRMHTTMAEARCQLWPLLEQSPAVIVDWLPWSHTFGANHNLFTVLRSGGSLYIDYGRPVPGLMDVTLANIGDVAPNIFLNVPRGYDMLVDVMDRDTAFRNKFFGSVRVLFYAGAALPLVTWQRLQAHSIAAIGHVTPMLTAWGSTETSPVATDCYYQADSNGNIGVPIPGSEVKLVPNGTKLEARVRGPNVTPGYFRNPELTAAAFDEEGFYRIGDALRLSDENDPNKGLMFDGRISEDFKLSSATWVNVGAVKARALAALSPAAQDVVVAGHNADHVGLLIFPNVAACRAIAGLPDDTPLSEVLAAPAVVDHVRKGLERLKAQGEGSSSYARAAILLSEPPSINDGEITDKGYINQRSVLARRAVEVEKLYAPRPVSGRIDL